jgi:nucleoside-diphosphate-sugar epimerase
MGASGPQTAFNSWGWLVTETADSQLTGRKVLVTGGAGFIGSHLCDALVGHGAHVICLDDLSAGKRSNVAHLEAEPNFRFVRASVCDSGPEMDALFEGVDTIFHNAASKKNVCLLDPQRDLEVNGGGALNLLQLSMKHGIRKFVHASTGSVYGEPRIFPTDEDHPFRPVSYYGVSKLAGERYVDAFHSLYGLDTTILRYFHVYGPRQESDEFGGVVSIFLHKITSGENPVVFGDGEQVRSFTWVGDLVAANLRAAVSPRATGEAYNAASGIRVTISDLALGMLKILDPAGALSIEHGPPLVGDIMEFDVSNAKIREQLGVEFHSDFWGTLRRALDDVDAFLGQRVRPNVAA